MRGYALLRPDGKFQKTSTIVGGTVTEIYEHVSDAHFVNRTAYKDAGMKVVVVNVVNLGIGGE